MRIVDLVPGLVLTLAAAGLFNFAKAQDCVAKAPPSTGCCDKCGQPCMPPCGPPRGGQPRKGQPREGVPTAPRGAYVAPPQSGTVEGPRRGTELGGLSLTLPELTIGLPRIRLHGCSAFRREGQMHLDSGTAPFVEYPYFATAGAAGTRGAEESDRSRGAEEEPKDRTDRGARGPQECPHPPRACTSREAYEDETQRRLTRLEQRLENQIEVVNRCIGELQKSRGTVPVATPAPNVREELPAPAHDPNDYQGLRQLPPVNQREVGQVTYWRPIEDGPPAAVRLPPVRD